MQNKKTTFKLLLAVTCFFFSLQQSFAQVDKLKNALSDTSIKMIGKLQEEGNRFRYDFHDIYSDDSIAKDLQAAGYHGGGPSWLGIIYGAFQACENNLIESFEMKVEVTGVTFWASNKDDLEKIGRLVNVIKSDDTALQLAIDKATELDIMQ
ncbi:hypothetical protein [Tenacibaculum agarivorans]|uniref:hypothetical protein n=1 Tax=Tenacibaculum agarivorans TaxID=1908389 RepID=UPI00094B9EF5|nr:hypothetical protein [Tenacibaculum agarivorans]